MSKSYGNDIGLTDLPEDMYGKVMSITDNMIIKYLTLAADGSDEFVKMVESDLNNPEYNPRDAKRLLGRTLVELYYGKDQAKKAEEHFDQVIVNKNIPDIIPEYRVKSEMLIVDILHNSEIVKSKSEARRLINQGAVSFNSEKIVDANLSLDNKINGVIKVGKRRFLKIV